MTPSIQHFFARNSPVVPRVLVVEDDEDLRGLIADALAFDGADVTEAPDGLEAERIFERTERDGRPPFDLVITDIKMPRKSGLDLARALRARGSRVPIIFVSAFADTMACPPTTLIDRAATISKPFEMTDLLTAVWNIEAVASRSEARPSAILAEDDAELRGLLAESLREGGFEVRTAKDGRDLLTLLTAASRKEIPIPEVIVTDVRMPRCGGLEVLRALRLAGWQVPVLLLTAFPDRNTLALAAELGAACTLEKPIEADVIVRAARILTKRRDVPRAEAT